ILLFSPDILDQQRIQLIHILLNDLKFCAALFPDMQDCILHFSIEHPCVHLAFKHIIIDLIDLSLHLFICRHLSAIHHTVSHLVSVLLCFFLKCPICIRKQRNRLNLNSHTVNAVLSTHRLSHSITDVFRQLTEQLPVFRQKLVRHVRCLKAFHRSV